jgi:hypothetical protein
MHTPSRTTSATTDLAPRNPSVLRATTIGAVAATVANLALWGIGRAADASLVVDPWLGDPNVQVDALKVVLTTLAPFAAGAGLLALAVRRSLRWVTVVMIVAGVFAVGSAAGPLDGGHDTTTGALLAAMHVTTGTAFVLAAASVRAR